MKTQVGFNGKRLKAARLYRGLTISEEAKMSDISKQAISQFENGKTEPRLETLMKIMQVNYYALQVLIILFFYIII